MTERHAAAYREVRERTCALVRSASPEAMEQIAPATPEWRVRDLLAHLVGVTSDATEGRLDGVATDPWTAAQVDARRDHSVDDMLAEWDALGPQFEAALVVIPTPSASQAVFDAVTHELDMRHALGAPGGRECDAVAIAFEFCTMSRTGLGEPGLRIVTEAGAVDTGAGEPAATVTTSRFEFIRAVSGRRSADEIAAFGWEGAVDPEIIVFTPLFTMRETPLSE
jgi:uncharacterized protein (TIGR03083 family)